MDSIKSFWLGTPNSTPTPPTEEEEDLGENREKQEERKRKGKKTRTAIQVLLVKYLLRHHHLLDLVNQKK